MTRLSQKIKRGNFTPDTQSIVTAAGVTQLTVLSATVTIFTGATTQTCRLPQTSTIDIGRPFTIVNTSSDAVTVQSFGTNQICILQSGMSITLQCVNVGVDTAGAWMMTAMPAAGSNVPLGGVTDGTQAIAGSKTFTASLGVTGRISAGLWGETVDFTGNNFDLNVGGSGGVNASNRRTWMIFGRMHGDANNASSYVWLITFLGVGDANIIVTTLHSNVFGAANGLAVTRNGNNINFSTNNNGQIKHFQVFRMTG